MIERHHGVVEAHGHGGQAELVEPSLRDPLDAVSQLITEQPGRPTLTLSVTNKLGEINIRR